MVPTLGAIMVLQLLGSLELAGIATGILGGCRFLVAYPIGALTDRHGRRVGLVLGLMLSLVGALAIGWSMASASFPVFLLGLGLFGLGVGAGQQLRAVAAGAQSGELWDASRARWARWRGLRPNTALAAEPYGCAGR